MNKLYNSFKIYFAFLLCLVFLSNNAISQITNVAFGTTSLNTGTNLLVNGGFENCTASPGFCGGFWGANTTATPKRDISNWLETGGGTSTYAGIVDAFGTSEPDPPEGSLMINFGNDAVTSSLPLIFNPTGEVTFAGTPTFTHFGTTYGATDEGVGIEQTLTGLTIGNTYRLEMYVTGRDILNGSLFSDDGFFKVEIVDGASTYSKFLAVPTKASVNNYVTLANPFMRYYIKFKPTTTTATIRFISYGYIVIFGSPDFRGPEVFIDNVSVNDLGSLVPLKLISFNSKLTINNIVELNWETVDEINVKNIEVEKSIDARNFKTIATITAQNKPQNKYILNDAIEENILLYYRLKIIDIDGTFMYSKIIIIKNKSSKNITYILENPTKNIITLVNTPQKTFSVSLINGNGLTLSKNIYNNTSLNTKTTLDISTLAVGVYYLKINSLENNETLKFIKQ
jgi:Secretion system C-terminal sorting domain